MTGARQQRRGAVVCSAMRAVSAATSSGMPSPVSAETGIALDSTPSPPSGERVGVRGRAAAARPSPSRRVAQPSPPLTLPRLRGGRVGVSAGAVCRIGSKSILLATRIVAGPGHGAAPAASCGARRRTRTGAIRPPRRAPARGAALPARSRRRSRAARRCRPARPGSRRGRSPPRSRRASCRRSAR